VIAVVVALSIGAFVGSLVTHAIDSDGGASRATTFVARGTPALTAVDVGNGSKAIEGPMLAERFTGLASVKFWDAGKLQAMKGRQLAEQFRSEAGSAVVWDAGKLEAMEGRQLAEEVRHRPHGGPLG
jgi:hypothetical protein